MTTDEAAIILVTYNLSWPDQFEHERNDLLQTIQEWLVGPIEHVGSTAIPGLAAKPVIDIMAAVESLEASRPAIAVLSAAGYCYSPYRPDVEHWFCKPSPAFRTHHLHLVPYGSTGWNDCLGRQRIQSNSNRVQAFQASTNLPVLARVPRRQTWTAAQTRTVKSRFPGGDFTVRLKPDTPYCLDADFRF